MFLLGLLVFRPTGYTVLQDLLVYVLVIQPIGSNILHQYFNHNYVVFRNDTAEWAALLFLTTYSFWRPTDLKSYHVRHHTKWTTDLDPTASEIAQGKIRYYLGITKPNAIPQIAVQENAKLEWINKNFLKVKLAIYLVIAWLLGFETVWHLVLAQQFFGYALAKIHDITFHSSVSAQDRPWLFPLYYNDAWHIEHHKEFSSPAPWHYRYINLQYWYSRLLFK
jgi:hypothetical protein